MKNKLLIGFSALLLHSMSWGQIIEAPSPAPSPATKLSTRIPSAEKSVNCIDTLRYPLIKEFLLGTPSFATFNLQQSNGYKFSMAFLNAEPLTISGVEVAGLKTAASTANLEVTIEICSIDATNNPTAVLASAVLPVSNTAVDYLAVNFSSPITVSGNYAVQIYTTSVGGQFTIYLNNSAINSYDEDFARVYAAGVYYPIPTGFGPAFNFEPLVAPIVSYPITSSFTPSATSVCLGTEVTFTNNSTPVNALNNRFESLSTFLDYFGESAEDSTYIFDYDDASLINVGMINPHTYAAAGTYDATLLVQGGFSTACPDVATQTITITAPDDATFAYSSNTICSGGANETPTVNATGTFSATPVGLVFANTATGEIDMTTSADGTYAVTYTTSGTCSGTTTQNITITSSPDASFTYASATYCGLDSDPSPVFTTGSAGVFSSTAGLEIDPSTGVIDLSASTAGTYSVTNQIAASGVCPQASDVQTVVIEPAATPAFNAVGPYCAGDAISALPTASTNSITGTWSPAIDNTATTTYIFTPGVGQCAVTSSLTITVNQLVTPVFAPVTSYCAGETIPALPTTSTNAITGVWSPVIDNQNTTTYTFTPTAGQCATTNTLTIVIDQPVTPTFTAIPQLCIGDAAPTLSATSNNAVTGTWNPSTISTSAVGTTTYTFIPNAGQCADNATLVVVVDSCLSIEEISGFEVIISPNPASESFVISANGVDQLSYTVVSEDGKLVIEPKTIVNGISETVSVVGFAKGMYFVRFSTATQTAVRKITVN